jgi:hypothetical protein
MKAVAGVALVLLHAAAFVAIAARSGGTELAVELAAPASIEGRVPAELADRVRIATDGGPLARRRWSIAYRGGYTREVGASALAGPFQDPAAPPCDGRVIVGQKLLDQIAGATARVIDDELRGQHIFALGDYVRLDGLKLRFAQIEAHLMDRAFAGDVPHGYIRATGELVFSRVRVPLTLAIVPERGGHFRIAARAEVEVDNSVLQWVSDELGGDKLATRLARHEVDGVIATTLAPPPPLSLGDGQELAFTYCAGDVEVAEGAYGALPFAVAIHGHDVPLAPTGLAPISAGGTAPTSSAGVGTTLALELDVNGMNALLAELWRTGWLDRRLAEVGLDRRFAEDPTVAQFLSVRISPPRLALPPVVARGEHGLRLASDARIAIRDADTTTTGRVFGALDFALAAGNGPSARAVDVDLGALELACERSPTTLVPCYADLVAALRDRGADFHGALTDAFAKILSDIFVDRRLADSRFPAELAIRGAVPAIAGSVVHVELDAALVTK